MEAANPKEISPPSHCGIFDGRYDKNSLFAHGYLFDTSLRRMLTEIE